METIEDIVREMRELAKEVQGNSISNAYELLMGLADRIEEVVAFSATTTPTSDKYSQVGNAPPMNINRINNYDEMVNAWNDYVYHHSNGIFSLASFFVWLFDKEKGE